jgi:hypothetical protein
MAMEKKVVTKMNKFLLIQVSSFIMSFTIIVMAAMIALGKESTSQKQDNFSVKFQFLWTRVVVFVTNLQIPLINLYQAALCLFNFCCSRFGERVI